MTSEGGGAVAFPVMTLVLHILPEVARDFSMMIQSCGMSAAAFTIFFMRVQLEWHAIVLCTLGMYMYTVVKTSYHIYTVHIMSKLLQIV